VPIFENGYIFHNNNRLSISIEVSNIFLICHDGNYRYKMGSESVCNKLDKVLHTPIIILGEVN
jgi:hypothetical protein